MIPSIFEAKAQGRDDWSRDEKAAWSRSMSGALIGFAGAIGALGGVFINIVLRASYVGDAKSATNAFWVFLAFYVICAIVTWFVFLRMTDSRARRASTIGRAPAPVPQADARDRHDPDRVLVLRRRLRYRGATATDPETGGPVIARVSGDKLHPANFGRLCTKGATHAEMMAADDGRLTSALLRPTPRRRTGAHARRRRRRRGGPAAAGHRRRTRPRRGRAVRVGPDVHRGAVSGDQAGQGLPADVHIESNSRLCMASAGTGLQAVAGRGRAARVVHRLRLRRPVLRHRLQHGRLPSDSVPADGRSAQGRAPS